MIRNWNLPPDIITALEAVPIKPIQNGLSIPMTAGQLNLLMLAFALERTGLDLSDTQLTVDIAGSMDDEDVLVGVTARIGIAHTEALAAQTEPMAEQTVSDDILGDPSQEGGDAGGLDADQVAVPRS